MLDCFELPLATPNDFDTHQDLVARVHDGLSKSTAHFTYRTDHLSMPEKIFLPALGLVLQILQRRFFDPLQEVPKTHADLPQTRSRTIDSNEPGSAGC